MIKLIANKVYLINGKQIVDSANLSGEKLLEAVNQYGNFNEKDLENAASGSIAADILKNHNCGDEKSFKIKFDALTSHDITYVGVVQTAKSSGLDKFPVPYVLTNCHNSLCAVGGTINEDDHIFGLSAARKYGGIYVPAHIAVIHQYMREMMSSCGSMILGSDSHTRYGALGTMAIGEGGPEIVKQLLNKTYDIPSPKVTAVYLTGKARKGVGPQDVALAIIGATFKNGFVKNKIMEFVGDGIQNLSVDFRNGIDVMTTETTCLSSIWVTDDKVKDYYRIHNREDGYKKLQPKNIASYDSAVIVDLSKVEPVMAMPFHPSNVYKLSEVISNPADILKEVEKNALENDNIKIDLLGKIVNGKLNVQQGIIAGCAGGIFENIQEAAAILKRGVVGSEQFNLSVYPSSQPIYIELVRNGSIAQLMQHGAVVKTAFCGPCFGAGDVPGNNTLSIRHTTRNFPNREGSKPSNGQIASVALMDARSIAATAANGGVLTSAMDIDYDMPSFKYNFDKTVYDSRVYYGYNKANSDYQLKYGPNIADWPKMIALTDNVLLKFASVINDPVTTTDELIPSGETSSYRSNPMKLAEFTLSRKDPAYVGKAKAIKHQEDLRQKAESVSGEFSQALQAAGNYSFDNTLIASTIYAVKPGDGSAREQAASCQRVLGGVANVASEYATKRYRSNLINWGMLPILTDYKGFLDGDFLFIENAKQIIAGGISNFKGKLIRGGKLVSEIDLSIDPLTDDEKQTVIDGCLMNFYGKNLKK